MPGKNRPSRRRHRKTYIPRARNKLHSQEPNCFWCGVPTINDGYDFPERATLDHVKSWEECQTIEEYKAAENLVLACRQCNQARDRDRQIQSQSNQCVPVLAMRGGKSDGAA